MPKSRERGEHGEYRKSKKHRRTYGGSRKGIGFLGEALGFVGGLIAGKLVDQYVPQAQYTISGQTVNLANLGIGTAAVAGGHLSKSAYSKPVEAVGIGMLSYEALQLISGMTAQKPSGGGSSAGGHIVAYNNVSSLMEV